MNAIKLEATSSKLGGKMWEGKTGESQEQEAEQSNGAGK